MSTQNTDYVKVCPSCKSPNVSLDNSNPTQFAVGLPAYYSCNNCGYTGMFFPEVKRSDLNEFENEVSRKKLSEEIVHQSEKVSLSTKEISEIKKYLRIGASVFIIMGAASYFTRPPFGIFFIGIAMLMLYFTYSLRQK